MNRKYINQIIRKLKCSKKKREEIRKQLISEMEDISQDEMQSLESPAELVEEFNGSFSEEEKKKYKKEKLMKIVGLILLLLVLAAGMIWWLLPKQIWLEDSKVFDANAVKMQAELVLEYFDQDDYESLKKISNDEMREFFNTHDLRSNKVLIAENWGRQETVGKVYMFEVKQMGKKSAVVQMNVQYENTNITYTISFNRDMELAGFWMK